MEYIRNNLKFTISEPTVITLGKFDGMHRGHELLIENLFAKKRELGAKTLVFTFDIPPRPRAGKEAVKVLTTNEEKRWIFAKTGVDYLYECPFTPQIMSMEPGDFIRWIVDAFAVRCIVAGEDFRFGHNRAGNTSVLADCAGHFGYELIVRKKIQEDGRDISSSFVREEIEKSNIEKANRLLGYPFFLRGTVVHGRQLGRTIGFPTVNMVIPPEKLMPQNGVYASRVHIGEETWPSVTNVGSKPTVTDSGMIGAETHIIGYDGDLYGEALTVEFLRFLRPEQKFASVAELQAQMEKDTAYSKVYYKNITK